ncbi:DUF599 domain-containing protein [Thiocystis violacea]|uniref:DUF599 domain-containing protein n=1 Tax=Thiocystis violacea TaxID=13725 RepID=UPI001905EF38|nr:DUF599 domain-containing protein [Thiocystis violacea]MBK1720065.1 hypothetical protein [Thiocystis violacea]
MPDWWTEYGNDFLWVGVGVALLAAYHLYLAIRERREPLSTLQGVNRSARRAWVQVIMADPSLGILGVQTLRNSTMTATFLASTSVVLVMGVLTLSGQADRIAESWHASNPLGSRHPILWELKLLVLLVDLLVAFFSFTLSIRLYNHLGFQISLPRERRPAVIDPERVARHLNRAGAFFSVGMRAYYLAVPLVFWLFAPQLMAAASLILVIVLYFLDRAPDSDGED